MDPSEEEEENQNVPEQTQVVLRKYQEALVKVCVERNSIIFLPTGAGKTFVAIQTLIQMGHRINRYKVSHILPSTSSTLHEYLRRYYPPNRTGSLEDGGKRGLFLAPTKALVFQHTRIMESSTPFTVAPYVGDMGVDFWSKGRWHAEFNKNQVIVMTPAIMQFLLTSSFVSLEIFAIIIVDECHNGVDDHSYRAVMREMSQIEKKNQPRILGLTATLLNRTVTTPEDVKASVEMLELTYHAQIATCDSLPEVIKHSADPSCRFLAFGCANEGMHPRVDAVIDQCLATMKNISAIEKEQSQSKVPGGYRVAAADSYYKMAKRIFDDIKVNFEELGTYGAALAALFHYLEYEKKKIMANDKMKHLIYSQFGTVLNTIQSILWREMGDDQGPGNIVKFTSPKAICLLNDLKESVGATTIIFVKRRSTSVVLYQIIKQLGLLESNGVSHVKPGFLIGGRANPLSRTRESELVTKWQQTTLNDFYSGNINLVIATSVMEEGVDVPVCNKVYRFDLEDLHYRSYIQCKGRARSKTGEFIVLVRAIEASKYNLKIKLYNSIEKELYKCLIGKYNERSPPTADAIERELYKEEVEPFYVSGPKSAHVTGVTAIVAVQKYCSKLPQDLFSVLTPSFFFKNRSEKKISCAVQLPIISPLRGLIEGNAYYSKKMAKRSAFVETVKKLHELGELTDDLTPRRISSSDPDFNWLLPNYRKEPTRDNLIPGTKRFKRVYDIKCPDVLAGCLPVEGRPSYLHVIDFAPAYPTPTNNRHAVFHQLLSSTSTYAILSSKPIPQVCDFSLYMSVGEITCRLLNNAATVVVTAEQIEQLRLYHMSLFMSEMLATMKECSVLSNCNGDNAYFIVPVEKLNPDRPFQINWNVITNFEELINPTDPDKVANVSRDSHHMTIVSPVYRQDRMWYMVTDVLDQLTPHSPFPDPDVSATYSSYFFLKYSLKIKSGHQPLLEVKKMPNVNGNYIRPRGAPALGIRSRRKRLAEEEDFDEKLVPELCEQFRYPAALWIKAILTPSALHRINALLLQHELHSVLMADAGAGSRPNVWSPLLPHTTTTNESPPAPASSTTVSTILSERPFTPMRSAAKPAKVSTLRKIMEDPMNLDANLCDVASCDITQFVQYINKIIEVDEIDDITPAISRVVINPPKVHELKLNLIQPKKAIERVGPQLRDLLAATTAKSAGDIINLERLETLGDSFLKLTTTLFLYKQFPALNEGQLTDIKGRLVSNKNLLYCAQKKGIPSIININEFTVEGDWMPPLCEVPHEIAVEMKAKSKDPCHLFKMYISHDEKLSGVIQQSTRSHMMKLMRDADVLAPEALASRSCGYLQQKVISDKSVADSVEAVIGAYLVAVGLNDAVKILNWLEILPNGDQYCGSAESLFQKAALSSALPGSTPSSIQSFLNNVNYEQLEKTINYSFKDKAYLLQAITHPTYSFHRNTDCYQRLEFLGDAVLDFLITCFIWQEANHFDPGKITLLRSALVNNTTFACLTVRYGLHRYLLKCCNALDSAVAGFVNVQESHDHRVDEAVLYHTMGERDVAVAEAVEVPKALGDVFEALAGAIFLDSGNSLETVWRVYYPLMKMEMDSFLVNIPRNSLQMLEELTIPTSATIKYLNATTVRVRIELLESGIIAYGFGPNKSTAKCSAAKVLLRKLQHYKSAPQHDSN